MSLLPTTHLHVASRFTLSLIFALMMVSFAHAASLQGVVADSTTGEGIPAVNVTLARDSVATHLGASTDSLGHYRVEPVPAGRYLVHFTSLNYTSATRSIQLDDSSDARLNIALAPSTISTDTVTYTVTVTRFETYVNNAPIRVEAVPAEEVQEKMSFADNVGDALRFSNGITMHLSRNLYEQERLRLRGLDSRYTGILRGGMPLIGYQPEQMGLWTVPLVGVKQFEIVKGDYSALYGTGAAGAVNTVPRSPFDDPTRLFGSVKLDSRGGATGSAYVGGRGGNMAISGVMAAERVEDDQGVQNRRYVVSPRVGFRNGGLTGFVGGTVLGWRREGGLWVQRRTGLQGKVQTPLFSHLTAGFEASGALQTWHYPTAAGSLPADSRVGRLDATLGTHLDSLHVLAGVEAFSEEWDATGTTVGSHSSRTALHLQAAWDSGDAWRLLYGIRFFGEKDRVTGPSIGTAMSLRGPSGVSTPQWRGQDQLFALAWTPTLPLVLRVRGSRSDLPRINHLTYVDPQGRAFLFLPGPELKRERMTSGSVDAKLTLDTPLGGWSGDLALFRTRLEHRIDPQVTVTSDSLSLGALMNYPAFTTSGLEFLSRLDFGDDAALLLGYTAFLPDATYERSPGLMLPRARHQGNMELDWELEGTGLRLELENKVVGAQKTPTNPFRREAPPYVIWGFSAEYTHGWANLFMGIDNIGGFHQEDEGPQWGPREGRTVFVGSKVRL